MKLIIVMPVYNEEGCIKKVINEWVVLLENKFTNDDSHILAVNDGSKDNTGKILNELGSNRLVVVHQM